MITFESILLETSAPVGIQANTSGTFWTNTNIPNDPNDVWCISFSDFMISICAKNTETQRRWCVRGGQGRIDY